MTLQELIRFILVGWPSTQGNTSGNIHSFWNYRDKLSIIDGIVLKGTCIIVPEILRPQIIKPLHYASEHRPFRELVSDAGVNFTSDKFQEFCTMLDIKCKISSSYHHSSNRPGGELYQVSQTNIQEMLTE